MSSTPFYLGLPVVDRLKAIKGSYILRTKTEKEYIEEINRIEKLLTKKDLIKVSIIGYRPDHPVPIAMHFVEVCISPGKAEEWMWPLGPYSGAWSLVTTGVRE